MTTLELPSIFIQCPSCKSLMKIENLDARLWPTEDDDGGIDCEHCDWTLTWAHSVDLDASAW